jgi:hypothetical protein
VQEGDKSKLMDDLPHTKGRDKIEKGKPKIKIKS